MTSVSAGHVILTPIQPERAATAVIEPMTLPTLSRELYRVTYRPPNPPHLQRERALRRKKRF